MNASNLREEEHMTMSTQCDTSFTIHNHNHNTDLCVPSYRGSGDTLLANVEQLLAAARPRLLYLAQASGVPADAADDVVQESLISAWRHLTQLQAPERFDSWLDSICRNASRRHLRRGHTFHALASLSHLSVADDEGWSPAYDIPDPSALDPAEELSHQDLEVLLDRALGYLPRSTRELVELYYLAELPKLEVASRLGLSANTLEVRLHRARRQLRQILESELRAEAEAFGMVMGDGLTAGWRETREWCTRCGGCRLYGSFEQLSDGRFCVHFRCPECQEYLIRCSLISLGGHCSFRPALKRIMQWSIDYLDEGLKRGTQTCPHCGVCRPACLAEGEDLASLPHLLSSGLYWIFHCPSCNETIVISAGISVLRHPEVQEFIAHHPRWISEPEVPKHYGGQQAYQLRLMDVTSHARLTLFTQAQTLEVLATFLE